jgi:uncharacterized membrane protein
MKNSKKTSRASVAGGEGKKVAKIVTINQPVEQVYGFWRNLENLPRFMRHLESVNDLGGGRSHWVVNGPAGKRVEWDAEIIEDKPNEMISWRSIEGSGVANAGSVWFQPAAGDMGTDVKVAMKYSPPAGKLGVAIAKLFGRDAEAELEDDLFIFKALMETGKVPDADAMTHRGEAVRDA